MKITRPCDEIYFAEERAKNEIYKSEKDAMELGMGICPYCNKSTYYTDTGVRMVRRSRPWARAKYVSTFRCYRCNAQWETDEWSYVPEYGKLREYFCTACGEDIVLTGRWNYCPMCGAKMDGEQNG